MGKLPVAALLCAASLLAASPDRPWAQRIGNDQKIDHALNRLTFGPRPGDPQAVRSMGLKKWIDAQLHPDRISEDPRLEEKLKPLDTLSMSTSDMLEKYPTPQMLRRPAAPDATAPTMTAVRPIQTVARQLQQGKLLRAIYSNRQLQEVLTDFWYNHFNVFLDKGADRYLVTAYEREAIRPHVLGKFQDLLLATAKSPAMLFYLDNWQSTGPLPPGRGIFAQTRVRRGLNENYGRELLELHTLGVDGGYSQKDVTEVARCFTGWTIFQPRMGGDFTFNARLHDRGEKTFLGITIPAGGGQEDGERVLEILARHPATARFISWKLAQRFVADEPPAALVDRMAQTFRKTDGDLREVMRTMLESKEFWSQGAYRTKIKSPLETVVSAVRAVDADVIDSMPLAQQLAQLGQPLYRKQEPTGYSNAGSAWVNSAGLVARMNFAAQLANGNMPGVKVADQSSALLLGAPEFQKR